MFPASSVPWGRAEGGLLGLASLPAHRQLACLSHLGSPDGNWLNSNRQQLTSGRREYYVLEVDQSVVDMVHEITINFRLNDTSGDFWVFL